MRSYKKEAEAITKQIIEIVWYMRGGVSYSEAWNLSIDERDKMHELIKENIERTEKTGLPLL